LSSDQRAFDGSFAVAHFKVDYLQFITHYIHSICALARTGLMGAVFPEMRAIGNRFALYPAVVVN
jgi:hypothetical protein